MVQFLTSLWRKRQRYSFHRPLPVLGHSRTLHVCGHWRVQPALVTCHCWERKSSGLHFESFLEGYKENPFNFSHLASLVFPFGSLVQWVFILCWPRLRGGFILVQLAPALTTLRQLQWNTKASKRSEITVICSVLKPVSSISSHLQIPALRCCLVALDDGL